MRGPGDPSEHRAGRIVRATSFVLGLGAVSWAWSEVGFWAHFRADDSAATWIATWLLYSLVAGVVIRVVRRFPTLSPASVILVGALYGWLVEGVAAATLYLALPVSIVWTGVAWHGLLTVAVGWVALPAALRRGGVRAVVWCGLVGLLWGVWSTLWWASPPDDGQPVVGPDVAAYALFVSVVSAAGIVGYVVMDRAAPQAGDLQSRRAAALTLVVLTVWWGLTVVAAIPWAPVVLGALVAVAWYSLRRLDGGGAHAEPDTDAEEPSRWAWAPGLPWRSALPLLWVPCLALAVYALLAGAAPVRQGEGPWYASFVAAVAALSVLGAVALLWALWQAWRRPVEPQR